MEVVTHGGQHAVSADEPHIPRGDVPRLRLSSWKWRVSATVAIIGVATCTPACQHWSGESAGGPPLAVRQADGLQQAVASGAFVEVEQCSVTYCAKQFRWFALRHLEWNQALPAEGEC